MSDRIVVMNAGRIAQIGTPQEVFERPASVFVAEFMGLQNVVRGIVQAVNGQHVAIESANRLLWGRWSGDASPRIGSAGFFAVHPSHLHPVPEAEGFVSGPIDRTIYQGTGNEIECQTQIGVLTAISRQSPPDHSTLFLAWSPDDAVTGPDDNFASTSSKQREVVS